MQLSLVILATVVSSTCGMYCHDPSCSNTHAGGCRYDTEPCPGYLVQNGSYPCGCCPVCAKDVGEGEMCKPYRYVEIHANRHISRFNCVGEDMFCDENTRVCTKKNCEAVLQAAHDAHRHIFGHNLPKCEADGSYAPVQCLGSVCSCVNKEGRQLYKDENSQLPYQTDISNQKDVNCRCAVDQDKYRKSGLIGRLFSCSTNGNYAKVGCTGSVCYCVDENGKQIGSGVNISQRDSLNC